MLSCFVLWHSPHDVISDIKLAPAGTDEDLVFIIVRGNLFVSSNGGASWYHSRQGLGPYWLSSLALSERFKENDVLYISSFGGGVYISENRGMSWRPFNEGLDHTNVSSVNVVQSPGTSETLVAITGDINPYPTKEMGHTWESLFKKKDGLEFGKFSHIYIKQQETGKWEKVLVSGSGFVAAKYKQGTIFLAESSGKIHVSRDGGRSFTKHTSPLQNEMITCMEVISDEEDLLLGTTKGLIHQKKQKRINTLLKGKSITSITLSADQKIFVTTAHHAVFMSHEKSKTWKKCSKGLTTNPQADEPGFHMPHFKCLALCQQNPDSSTIYVGGFNGLFKSTDSGESFLKVQTLSTDMIVDFDISENNRKEKNLCISTYGNGLYLRGGDDNKWRSCNLNIKSKRLGSVIFSPSYEIDNTLYCACEEGVLRSSDRGDSWEMLPVRGKKSPQRFRTDMRSFFRSAEVTLHKTFGIHKTDTIKKMVRRFMDSARIRMSDYIFPTSIVMHPATGSHATLFVGTRSQGLFCSTDSGNMFTCILDTNNSPVFSLCLSPEYAEDRTVFAGLNDGLYRTINGGESWTKLTEDHDLRAPKVSVSPDYKRDKVLLAGDYSGLYKSLNGGKTWKKLSVCDNDSDVSVDGIIISPDYKNDQQVIVNTVGKGVFRSHDGGRSFVKMFSDCAMNTISFSHLTGFPDFATMIAFSPGYPDCRNIYMSTMQSLYESNDDGISWQKVPRMVRHKNTSKSLQYTGKWRISQTSGNSNSGVSYSRHPDSEVSLVFPGKSVKLFGSCGPDHGIAHVFIDNRLVKTFDLFSPQLMRSKEIFSISGLEEGAHEIKVTVDKKKNTRSSDHRVIIDAFEVEL